MRHPRFIVFRIRTTAIAASAIAASGISASGISAFQSAIAAPAEPTTTLAAASLVASSTHHCIRERSDPRRRRRPADIDLGRHRLCRDVFRCESTRGRRSCVVGAQRFFGRCMRFVTSCGRHDRRCADGFADQCHSARHGRLRAVHARGQYQHDAFACNCGSVVASRSPAVPSAIRSAIAASGISAV